MLAKNSQIEMQKPKKVTARRRFYTLTRQVRICAYVRVSTMHEGQQNSLRSQTEYYEKRFSRSQQFQFVGIFSDAGISGAKENRPGFQAMLKKARAGEIDLIYTKSISRFARNALLLLNTVRELKSIGVGIIFEEQNINTLHNEGELMLTVLAGIAEEERRSIRANIKWSIERQFQRGKVMVDTGRLLGYGKDEAKNLVIIPKEAEIIRKIFRLYLSGLSGYRISQILNEQNIPSCLNGSWNSNRIIRIISNEKYAGSCLMQKSFINEAGKQIINCGQRAQYFIEDNHEPIISRSDWDLAQQIRKTREIKHYPYTSLLRCAYCGAALTRVVHERRWVSWICHQFLRYGKAACAGSRISEPRLIALTKDHPITEPVIVEEVHHEGNNRKSRQKDYRFIPVSAHPAGRPAIGAKDQGGRLLPGIQRQ